MGIHRKTFYDKNTLRSNCIGTTDFTDYTDFGCSDGFPQRARGTRREYGEANYHRDHSYAFVAMEKIRPLATLACRTKWYFVLQPVLFRESEEPLRSTAG